MVCQVAYVPRMRKVDSEARGHVVGVVRACRGALEPVLEIADVRPSPPPVRPPRTSLFHAEQNRLHTVVELKR